MQFIYMNIKKKNRNKPGISPAKGSGYCLMWGQTGNQLKTKLFLELSLDDYGPKSLGHQDKFMHIFIYP